MGNELFAVTCRVFYEKLGRTKYISHLDIVRCVSRALKRSKLPVWHTLGFNPHIYLTFALPLPLGYESLCESMDFRLLTEIPMEQVVERLNAVFPEGLRAYRAAPAGLKPEAIASADYELTLEFDSFAPEAVAQKFSEFCARPEVLVVKKGKKGERTIDIKPNFCLTDCRAENGALKLALRMAAGTTLNLSPSLLLEAFAADAGEHADWMRAVRTAIWDATGKPFSPLSPLS